MTLIIFGIIFIIGGTISLIFGSSLNNSYEARWNSFWESGRSNPGEAFVTLGTIAIVLGFILLIAGIIVKIVKSNKSAYSASPQGRTEYLDYLKGQGLITDNDLSNCPGGWQCPNCGRINSNYVGTCGCGMSKAEAQGTTQTSQQSEPHLLSKQPSALTLEQTEIVSDTEKKYCTQCGTELKTNAIFCSKCGTKQ